MVAHRPGPDPAGGVSGDVIECDREPGDRNTSRGGLDQGLQAPSQGAPAEYRGVSRRNHRDVTRPRDHLQAVPAHRAPDPHRPAKRLADDASAVGRRRHARKPLRVPAKASYVAPLCASHTRTGSARRAARGWRRGPRAPRTAWRPGRRRRPPVGRGNPRAERRERRIDDVTETIIGAESRTLHGRIHFLWSPASACDSVREFGEQSRRRRSCHGGTSCSEHRKGGPSATCSLRITR
jgi:hypothetical protein